MRLRFRPFLAAALLALGVASTPALSEDAGWFFGAGGGISKFKGGCAGVIIGPGSECDDRGTYWKVFGGYQFNSYFGYEVGYADLGELTRSIAGVSTDTLEAKAVEMVLVATVPFDQTLAVYGKYGLYHWEIDRTVVGVGAGTTEASGRDSTYGFGVKYSLGRNIALRMEWQRYLNVGDAVTGTFDVDVALLGVVLKF